MINQDEWEEVNQNDWEEVPSQPSEAINQNEWEEVDQSEWEEVATETQKMEPIYDPNQRERDQSRYIFPNPAVPLDTASKKTRSDQWNQDISNAIEKSSGSIPIEGTLGKVVGPAVESTRQIIRGPIVTMATERKAWIQDREYELSDLNNQISILQSGVKDAKSAKQIKKITKQAEKVKSDIGNVKNYISKLESISGSEYLKPVSYPQAETPVGQFGQAVVGGAPSLAASVGASAINPVFGIALLGSSIAGGSIESGEKEDKAQGRETDNKKLLSSSLTNAAVQAPLEYLGGKLVGSAAGMVGAGAKLKGILTGTIGEGVEEAIQAFPDAITKRWYGEGDETAVESTIAAMTNPETYSDAAYSGLVGVVLGGGGAVVGGVLQKPERSKLQKSIVDNYQVDAKTAKEITNLVFDDEIWNGIQNKAERLSYSLGQLNLEPKRVDPVDTEVAIQGVEATEAVPEVPEVTTDTIPEAAGINQDDFVDVPTNLEPDQDAAVEADQEALDREGDILSDLSKELGATEESGILPDSDLPTTTEVAPTFEESTDLPGVLPDATTDITTETEVVPEMGTTETVANVEAETNASLEEEIQDAITVPEDAPANIKQNAETNKVLIDTFKANETPATDSIGDMLRPTRKIMQYIPQEIIGIILDGATKLPLKAESIYALNTLQKNNVPATIAKYDFRNLGGANKFFTGEIEDSRGRKYDEAWSKEFTEKNPDLPPLWKSEGSYVKGHDAANVVFEKFAKIISEKDDAENGTQSYREGGDEFSTISQMSVPDLNSFVKNAKDSYSQFIRDNNLGRLIYPKQANFPLGLGFDFGVTSLTPGNNYFDESGDADIILEVSKKNDLMELLEKEVDEEGYLKYDINNKREIVNQSDIIELQRLSEVDKIMADNEAGKISDAEATAKIKGLKNELRKKIRKAGEKRNLPDNGVGQEEVPGNRRVGNIDTENERVPGKEGEVAPVKPPAVKSEAKFSKETGSLDLGVKAKTKEQILIEQGQKARKGGKADTSDLPLLNQDAATLTLAQEDLFSSKGTVQPESEPSLDKPTVTLKIDTAKPDKVLSDEINNAELFDGSTVPFVGVTLSNNTDKFSDGDTVVVSITNIKRPYMIDGENDLFDLALHWWPYAKLAFAKTLNSDKRAVFMKAKSYESEPVHYFPSFDKFFSDFIKTEMQKLGYDSAVSINENGNMSVAVFDEKRVKKSEINYSKGNSYGDKAPPPKGVRIPPAALQFLDTVNSWVKSTKPSDFTDNGVVVCDGNKIILHPDHAAEINYEIQNPSSEKIRLLEATKKLIRDVYKVAGVTPQSNWGKAIVNAGKHKDFEISLKSEGQGREIAIKIQKMADGIMADPTNSALDYELLGKDIGDSLFVDDILSFMSNSDKKADIDARISELKKSKEKAELFVKYYGSAIVEVDDIEGGPSEVMVAYGNKTMSKSELERIKAEFREETISKGDDRPVRDEFLRGQISLIGTKVRNAQDAVDALTILRDGKIEHAWDVFIKDGEIIAITHNTSFSPVGVNVPNRASKVDLKARQMGADTVYTVHNHPSGNTKPSDMDKESFLDGADIVQAEIILNHTGAMMLRKDYNGEVTQEFVQYSQEQKDYNLHSYFSNGEKVDKIKSLISPEGRQQVSTVLSQINQSYENGYVAFVRPDNTVVQLYAMELFDRASISRQIFDKNQDLQTAGAIVVLPVGGREFETILQKPDSNAILTIIDNKNIIPVSEFGAAWKSGDEDVEGVFEYSPDDEFEFLQSEIKRDMHLATKHMKEDIAINEQIKLLSALAGSSDPEILLREAAKRNIEAQKFEKDLATKQLQSEKKEIIKEANKKALKEFTRLKLRAADNLNSEQKTKIWGMVKAYTPISEKAIDGLTKKISNTIDKISYDNQKKEAVTRLLAFSKAKTVEGVKVNSRAKEAIKNILGELYFRKTTDYSRIEAWQAKSDYNALLSYMDSTQFITPDMERMLAEYKIKMQPLKNSVWDMGLDELAEIEIKILDAIMEHDINASGLMLKLRQEVNDNIQAASESLNIRFEKNKGKPEKDLHDGFIVDNLGVGSLTTDSLTTILSNNPDYQKQKAGFGWVFNKLLKAEKSYLGFMQSARDYMLSKVSSKDLSKMSLAFAENRKTQKAFLEKHGTNITLENGETVKMMPDHLIAIHLHSLNPHNLGAITESGFDFDYEQGMAFDEKSQSAKARHKLSMDDVIRISDIVTSDPVMNSVAEAIFYQNNFVNNSAINSASNQIAYKDIARVKNYFKLARKGVTRDVLGQDTTLDGLIQNFESMYNVEWAGSLKERELYSKNPVILEGALKSYYDSTSLAGAYSSFAIPFRQVTSFLTNIHLKAKAKAAGVDKFFVELEKTINDIKSPQSKTTGSLENFALKIMNARITKVFGANPIIIARQFFSITRAFPEIPITDIPMMISAFLDSLQSATKISKKGDIALEEVKKLSSDIRSRIEGGYAQVELGRKPYETAAREFFGVEKTLPDKLTEGIAWGDRIPIRAISKYVVDKADQLGLTGEARNEFIIDNVEKITHRSQPMYNIIHRSRAARGRSLTERLMTVFTSDANRIWNQWVVTRHLYKNAETPEDKEKYLKKAISVLLWSYFAQIGGMVLVDYLSDLIFNRKTKARSWIERSARYAIPIYGGTYVASMTGLITRIFLNDDGELKSPEDIKKTFGPEMTKTIQNDFDNILSGIMEDLGRTVRDAVAIPEGWADGNYRKVADTFVNVIDLAASWPGTPLSGMPVKNAYRYSMAVADKFSDEVLTGKKGGDFVFEETGIKYSPSQEFTYESQKYRMSNELFSDYQNTVRLEILRRHNLTKEVLANVEERIKKSSGNEKLQLQKAHKALIEEIKTESRDTALALTAHQYIRNDTHTKTHYARKIE